MKIYIHNIFKSAAVLAALSLASCVQIEEGADDAVGYLCPPSIEVDVTVEDLIDTKALEGFTFDAPEDSELHYIVKDKDGIVKHDAVGLWTAMAMPVGKYSVEAYHGENGFGAPYFYGKTGEDATIGALEQVVPEMTVGVQNAVLRVRVDSDFAKHFTVNSVVLTPSGKASHTVSAADITNWYFVPTGAALEVKIVGQSSAGVEKTIIKSVTPAAKSAHDLVCRQDGANVASISIENAEVQGWGGRIYMDPATQFANISAANQALVVYEVSKSGNWDDTKTASVIADASGNPTAYFVVKDLEAATYSLRARIGNLVSEAITVEVTNDVPSAASVNLFHTYDSDLLTGTQADVSFALSGLVATLQSKGYLVVESALDKNGIGVRSLATPSGTMTASDDWPYLPQGSDYSLTIKHWLTNDSADVETSVKTGISITEKPVFKVTLNSSYCSYDDYKGQNGRTQSTANANTRTAETIYNVGASWTISTDIMKLGHYSKAAIIVRNGVETEMKTTPATNSYTVAEFGGNSWETHTITTKVVFDGVEVTPGARTHVITGLPYKANPPKKEGVANPWESVGNNTFETDQVSLFYAAATYPRITSPTFNIPESINAFVYTKISKENKILPSANVYIRQYDKVNDKYTTLYTVDIGRGKTYETSTPLSATMTPDYPSFYIQHDYAASTNKVYVYYFNVEYN